MVQSEKGLQRDEDSGRQAAGSGDGMAGQGEQSGRWMQASPGQGFASETHGDGS